MKIYSYIILAGVVLTTSCKKTIDLYPESNLNTGTYYSNLSELNAAMTGIYNGLQGPMYYEWQMTELRSDNSKQGSPGSTSSNNRDLSDLDMFIPSPSNAAIASYWLASYYDIHNANILLDKMGVVYDPTAGSISYQATTLPVKDADLKRISGEAMFVRAYHYFNLVRLFGGVFLNYQPITPAEAKTMNRVSPAEIYKLIEADLKAAIAGMNSPTYAQQAAADRGRATSWAAKGLLAKVYLTLNRKAEALTLLNDVKNNSGYGLQSSYANVFSIANEMNSEILFAVRYKSPGLGIGSPFANLFAPLNSGQAVVLGDGNGLNYPTEEFDTLTNGDPRKPVLIAYYGTGTARKNYTPKYLSTLTVEDDAENDWPVLRFADILLMIAEAQGYTQNSLDQINLVRTRAGLSNLTMSNTPTLAAFEQALSTERRIELGFENQRWFDLVRFNTTMQTITAEATMKAHFAHEYASHYSQYTAPVLTLAQLQSYVTPQHLLLPIPQREIDTNTQLAIPQNPGY